MVSWRKIASGVVLLATLLGLGSTSLAQTRQRPVLRIDRVDASKPPKLRIYTTDLNAALAPITDRKRKSYRLLVDGVPHTSALNVQPRAKVAEPLGVVLVIQVSPSIREALTETVDSAKRLVRALPSGSKVGLIAYTDVVVTNLKPTKSEDVLRAIDDLRIRDEAVQVHLIDALKDALEALDNKSLPRQRLIVLVSDGLNADFKTQVFADIGRRALDKNVAIHSLGFAPLEPERLRRSLYELSRRSRGTLRNSKNPQQITDAFQSLQDEILGQRILTFDLSKFFDGKLHELQIELPEGQASNPAAIELKKLAFENKEEEEGLPVWAIILLVGGALTLLTVTTLVAMRVFGTKPPPPPMRSRSYDHAGDDEDEEEKDEDADEDEDDEDEGEGWGPDSRLSQRRDVMMPQDPRGSINQLFSGPADGGMPGAPPPAAGPAATAPGAPVYAQPGQQPYSQPGLPPASAGPGQAGAYPGAPGYPGAPQAPAPGYPGTGQAPAPGYPGTGQAPAPEAPAPGYPAAPDPYGGAAPASGGFVDPRQPQAPMAPNPLAPAPGVNESAPAGGDPFRLPLPDPDQFMQQRAGDPGQAPPPAGFGSEQPPMPGMAPPPAAAPPAAPPFGSPAGSSPMAGALPSPVGAPYTGPQDDSSTIEVHTGSGTNAPDLAPLPPAPAPGGSPSVSSRSGIPLQSPAIVPIAPVGDGAVQQGRMLDRKTMVMAVEELSGPDFAAWIVPLDQLPTCTTHVVKDNFVIGSDSSCDLKADGLSPRHGVIKLDSRGFLIETTEGGQIFSQPLNDADTFRVGPLSFLFKVASRFPAKQVGAARVEVLDGMDQGKSVALQDGVAYALGAAPGCDLVVRGEGVATRHAVVLRKDRTCYISDLGAERGIVFGGKEVGRQALDPGDEVTLGDIRVIFTFEDWNDDQEPTPDWAVSTNVEDLKGG